MPNPPSRHRRRLDPRWLAAPLLAAAMMAGAMSGEAIGSAPVIARHADPPPIAVRAAEFERSSARTAARRQLPDHYPLVTPTGTVPVAALASRGRFREMHEARFEQAERSAFDTPAEWDLTEDEIDRLERWEPGRHSAPRPAKSRETLAVAVPMTVEAAPTVSVARGANAPSAVQPMQGGETAPPARKTALPVEN